MLRSRGASRVVVTWCVTCCGHVFQEYQDNRKDLVIDDCNMKQTVYMYKCNGVTLQVKGKINSITVGTFRARGARSGGGGAGGGAKLT